MPTIEKLAENFVRAAQELMDATGGKTWLDMSHIYPAKAQMDEGDFENIFGNEGIEVKVRENDRNYPIEKSITVGGVKFMCLTNDLDTWAKLKGYVKKEAV